MRLTRSPLLEQVPLPGPASVAFRAFRYRAFRYPWHQHPEVELTWILRGSGLRYVGDSVEPFHAGDLCLLGPHLPHTWLSPEDETGPVRSLVVQFIPSRWGELLQLPEFTAISDLLARASRGLCFDREIARETYDLMTHAASPVDRFLTLLGVLERLAGRRKTRRLTFAPWLGTRRMNSDPRVRSLLEFLSKRSGSRISQRATASLVRLTPAAFSRFFRRAVGRTFSAYITEMRLSDACRRLLETDHAISEIAFEVGFENLSTFNRSFRQFRGMSPRDFRARAWAGFRPG